MQFAISRENGKVGLWCEQLGVLPDGRITFEVINGGWRGIYDLQKHEIFVDETGTTFYGKMVWQGQAPFKRRSMWQEALDWLNEQVALTNSELRDYIYVDEVDVLHRHKANEVRF